MAGQRFRVGIVGLKPGRGWAVQAHIPALRALSETFEIVGVANTNRASAEEAAAATGLPRAFADVAELIASPEVDIVTITVKVPYHLGSRRQQSRRANMSIANGRWVMGWPKLRKWLRSPGRKGSWA